MSETTTVASFPLSPVGWKGNEFAPIEAGERPGSTDHELIRDFMNRQTGEIPEFRGRGSSLSK